MIDLNSVELLVIHLNSGGVGVSAQITPIFIRKNTNSKITEYHLFLYVIIVLNFVEFLVLQYFWWLIQSHTSQSGHSWTSLSVGVPRPVRVGVTGVGEIVLLPEYQTQQDQ